MATTKRAGLPEFWTTGIAKLLVGENPCEFSVWVKGWHKIEKVENPDRATSLAKWKIEHTERIEQLRSEAVKVGYKVKVEQFFKLKGKTAVLTGKADLVLRKPDCRPIIADMKGGTPRESDVVQVEIYQVALPLVWEAPMQFEGQVRYPTHTTTIQPAEADAIKPSLFALLRKLGTPTYRPEPQPSEANCKFCDVGPNDCAVRWQGPPETAETQEF